jgi:hypothetical protein
MPGVNSREARVCNAAISAGNAVVAARISIMIGI